MYDCALVSETEPGTTGVGVGVGVLLLVGVGEGVGVGVEEDDCLVCDVFEDVPSCAQPLSPNAAAKLKNKIDFRNDIVLRAMDFFILPPRSTTSWSDSVKEQPSGRDAMSI